MPRDMTPPGPSRPVPFHLIPGLAGACDRLNIVDVGAAVLAGEEDIYRPLLTPGRFRVTAFEPQGKEAAERQERDPAWSVLPWALGDGRQRVLHETAWPPTSSLYEPDLAALDPYEWFADACQVLALRELPTARLDDVLDQEMVDFLKLDVQGAELDVLGSGLQTLSRTLVVHTEVEFFPIYRHQPLFDHVLSFMRQFGFEMFDLPRLSRSAYRNEGWPPASTRDERLMWGEAVFVPGRARLATLDERGTVNLAWVMHEVYGAFGFVAWLLRRLDERAGTEFALAYRAALEHVEGDRPSARSESLELELQRLAGELEALRRTKTFRFTAAARRAYGGLRRRRNRNSRSRVASTRS